MTDQVTVKVMTTEMLDRTAKEGRRHDFNRQLDQDWINAHVDWKAIHVIDWVMVHEHKNGMVTDPHMRCSMIVGTKKGGTQSVMIDMTTERYRTLPSATITTDDNGEKTVNFDQLVTV